MMIIDFRRKKTDMQPLYIYGGCVESLSVQIPGRSPGGGPVLEDLSWRTNTMVTVKKAQQRLYFHLRQDLLVSFYRGAVESILTYCICVWFLSCTYVHIYLCKYSLSRLFKSHFLFFLSCFYIVLLLCVGTLSSHVISLYLYKDKLKILSYLLLTELIIAK